MENRSSHSDWDTFGHGHWIGPGGRHQEGSCCGEKLHTHNEKWTARLMHACLILEKSHPPKFLHVIKALCIQLKLKWSEKDNTCKVYLSLFSHRNCNGHKCSESFSENKNLFFWWHAWLKGLCKIHCSTFPMTRKKNLKSVFSLQMVKGFCIPAGVQIFWIFSPTTTGFSFLIFSAASAL